MTNIATKITTDTISVAVIASSGLDLSHPGRSWWAVEARRLGSDWRGVLTLHDEAVTRWRCRYDPEYGGAP